MNTTGMQQDLISRWFGPATAAACKCGSQFPSKTARFCSDCGSPRGSPVTVTVKAESSVGSGSGKIQPNLGTGKRKHEAIEIIDSDSEEECGASTLTPPTHTLSGILAAAKSPTRMNFPARSSTPENRLNMDDDILSNPPKNMEFPKIVACSTRSKRIQTQFENAHAGIDNSDSSGTSSGSHTKQHNSTTTTTTPTTTVATTTASCTRKRPRSFTAKTNYTPMEEQVLGDLCTYFGCNV